MIQKILVVGATGMLGEPVARQLKSDGFQVRVLSRSAERARNRFGDGFEAIGGDVEDPASLDSALQTCQGVHINLNGMQDPDMERRGTENVLQVALKVGIQRVTYLSGASVCEENCWYAGTKAKFQAEAAIRASGIPYTVFRAHYFMESMKYLVRGNMALIIGKHPHPYYWAAAADYARLVSKAYATPAAANKTLYVCGPEALTMRQAMQIFTRIAYPEARFMNMPLWMAALIARLGNRKELQAALPFLHYCEKAKVLLSGSPDEANVLLGAPTTTVEAWSKLQVGVKSKTW